MTVSPFLLMPGCRETAGCREPSASLRRERRAAPRHDQRCPAPPASRPGRAAVMTGPAFLVPARPGGCLMTQPHDSAITPARPVALGTGRRVGVGKLTAAASAR